jgi:hypothetical protein
MNETGESPEADAATDGSQASAETRALAALKALFDSSSGLARDYLDLLAIEGRLAGRSLALILALALALALLLVAGWLFLGLAAAAWLIEHQWLNLWQAMLVTALAQLLMAALTWLVIRRLSNNLVFSGFRAALERPVASDQNTPP